MIKNKLYLYSKKFGTKRTHSGQGTTIEICLPKYRNKEAKDLKMEHLIDTKKVEKNYQFFFFLLSQSFSVC